MRRSMIIAAALASPGAALSAGDSVVCHVIYGGENFIVAARAADDPYAVRGEKIGRYFEMKVSFVTSPPEFAALSVYVYSTATGESVLIHQAKYPPGATNAAGPWGFTGFNYVYEPTRSSELQYWCEKQP